MSGQLRRLILSARGPSIDMELTAVAMEPVIRMFTSDSGTVRWVTTVAGTEGLEFSVSGPDTWRNTSLFTDPMALLRYQTEYERFLRASGYSVSPVNDRRGYAERRALPRPSDDRRRPA
jgi:hypothetical protein